MSKQNKFGTFGGVFVPSILTILGVIMYLRLPMIVGEAGLWATIGIIIVAHIISITTGLSVSSIATDKKVEAGGTYFMISRSLGLPIGGTLGLALFVGLSFSVSLYLIGFSESFLNYWGFSTSINNIRLTGSIVLLAVTTVTFISTSLAIKTQYFIMAAILLSLVSILFGSHNFIPVAPNFSNLQSTVPVMVLFGIFFPAVTGFEAGVSMSGDLKDPKKSIPFGSIMAIAVGFVVYIALAFFFAYTVDKNALTGDPQILLNIAWLPELVITGIWGATLSSALGSILGAPRILQATATDRISPKIFSKGYGPTNEPRNALLLTFLIAEAGILIGELDVIARVVSIFFITTYGFLNLSAAFEKWTSADFRPEFKVSGWISLLGAMACILVMIQLDFVAMLGAIIILGLLFLYLKRKELTLESGDAWSGVWSSLIKSGLTNLKKNTLHSRNWRPNIIMFSGEPKQRTHLIELGQSISGKLGMLSAFDLIKKNEEPLNKTHSELLDLQEGFFSHKYETRDVYSGMDDIARVYGFSGIEPNTVLMGWSQNIKHKDRFIGLIRNLKSYDFNSIFLKYDREKKYGDRTTIDIWWSGMGRNLSLAINLIRHISNSQLWSGANVRLLIINNRNDQAEAIYAAIERILEDFRENIQIRIVNNEINPVSQSEIISTESSGSDLVIIGLSDKEYQKMDSKYDEICHIINSLGSVILINASGAFKSYDVLPDRRSEEIELVDIQSLQLPDLNESIYPEIGSDTAIIDKRGQKVQEILFKKYILPISESNLAILKKLEGIIKVVDESVSGMDQIPDSYRKQRALDKLENDTLFRLNSLYKDDLKEKHLPVHQNTLEAGINWYMLKLKDQLDRYPRKLDITFRKEDFKRDLGDRMAMRAFKAFKRTKHWMFKSPFTNQINYRAVAYLYQYQNRKAFIEQYFQRLKNEESKFYNAFRALTGTLLEAIDEAKKELDVHTYNVVREKLDSMLTVETELQQKIALLREGRLRLEYRKNLELMIADMERLDVDRVLKKRIRSAKWLQELEKKISTFPEDYYQQMVVQLNLSLIELSTNSVKSRVSTLDEEFADNLSAAVHAKYVRQLEGIRKLFENRNISSSKKKFKLEVDFETELYEEFRATFDKMLKLVETMPESLEISLTSNTPDQDVVTIPLARMTEYYLKSRYEVVVEQHLEAFLDLLKQSIYTSRDLLSLAQFNLDNPDETSDSNLEIWQSNIAKLDKERERVENGLADYVKFAKSQLKEVFEPVSVIKIRQSADDFAVGLRSYQGQRVLTGLNKISTQASAYLRNILSIALYSRSKGVIFTKKFTNPKNLLSSNSRLLDLVDHVSPSKEVVKALPPYYVALFNGKSNISHDLWIPRASDNDAFQKAIKRYQSGHHGGILVLGERNSGKTSFIKEATRKFLKGYQVYDLFPPASGTTSPEVFLDILQKATAKNGDFEQIMTLLPKGGVVVINDLELFWTRTTDGLKIIKLLESLIDEFSDRVLFVVNMNPFAYKVINQITSFSDHFIENVTLSNFSAEELKDLVMKRHRSSGLSLGLKEGEESLSELQMAQLFNTYFTYSDGMPGTVLNGWLANIKKASANSLVIRKPETHSLSVFKELHEDWIMLLAQFALHKRLSVENISKITGWTDDRINRLILAMLRSGIIVEKISGVYHIEPFACHFIVKSLKEQGIL